MSDLRKPIDLKNPPDKVEVTVELSPAVADRLKAISLYSGLSYSALISSSLLKTFPEQVHLIRDGLMGPRLEVEIEDQKFFL